MIESGNTKLLPPFLRFVRGVVDSEDLPLNVSRESVRQNALLERIKKTLTSRLLKDLGSVAENNADLYEKFWKQFGIFLKEGAATDFSNREKLADLLRFNSTLLEDAEPKTTLKDYVSRMREEQQEIFYAVGSTRESLQLHPNLEYFRKQGYEVLFLFDQFDDYLMSELKEYSGKPFKSISQAEVAGLDATETEGEKLSKEEAQDVLGLFETRLKDRVEKVVESKRLVDSPCSLVDGRDGTSVQMERMMRMMDQEFQASKRTLEINLRHPLIKNLSALVQKSKSDPFLEDAVEQLYANALLVEGLLENPVEMLPRVNRFLADAAAHRIGAGAA
jgi:molecular chaperone HtpG